jgi:hypothetical protein
MAGRPPTYHADDERPVTVSLRVPKALYAQAQQYASQRRMSMTELLLDGLTMRLETPTDPREVFLSDESNTVIQQLREELKGALLDELRHEVYELLASAAGDGLGTESAGLAPAPREISYDKNIPVLQKETMKQCRHGHAAYPASKPECPECVNNRQRRHQAKLRAARQGADA